jgi:hypothetical protein
VQAILGFLGALAGAITVGGVAWWNQRYSARSRRRRAARRLLGEAAALQRRLDRARAEQVALTGVGRETAFLLDVWRTNPDLGELPFGIWKVVTGRVHSIQAAVADAERIANDGWSPFADHVYRELSDMLDVIVGTLQIASR